MKNKFLFFIIKDYLCAMIERIQCNKIKNLLSRFPAVAVLGARQTGKTTVAKQIAVSLKERVLYLDLEKDSHLQRLRYDAEAYLSLNREKLIIIDEVQFCLIASAH